MMDKLKSDAVKLGIHLSDEQTEQFEVYYKELTVWNERINLTSITEYEEVRKKHFLDSLTVAEALDFKGSTGGLRVIDVGTGAGLPGIPLKIVFPSISLTLLEATAKKTKFLEHLITKLGLKNVEIAAGRAEDAGHLPRYREKYDVVLSRAVAALPTLVELTLPFSSIGGSFIAQKKGDIREEVKKAEKAIAVLGGRLREIKPIALKELNDNRFLIIIDKVRASPAEYPRRAGMPAKRPITG